MDTEGDIFHIVNRGVEKRKIFLDEEDYLRFVHNLSAFNTTALADIYDRRVVAMQAMRWPAGERPLVDILGWCLMPNHFHLLAQERVEGGASIFTKKLTGGYTQSFNLKNKRIGVLFQGRSKIINVKDEEHFLHLPYYIFANPIKLIEPQWKEGGIKNPGKVARFLQNYRWSSLREIYGIDDFQTLTNKKSFFELFDLNEQTFKRDFANWLVS